MKKISEPCTLRGAGLIALIALIALITPPPTAAQTMQSDDVIVEIENIEIKTSDKPANVPQPPEEFRRQGFMIQTLKADKTSSSPFALTPSAFLIRAKPGSTFSLPLTIHNFKDPAVLQLELIPFIESSSRISTNHSELSRIHPRRNCEDTLFRGTENLADYSPTKNKAHPNFPLVSNTSSSQTCKESLTNVLEKGCRTVLSKLHICVSAAAPQNQQISIDCSRIKVASCLALDWLSIPTALQANLFVEAGNKEEFDLSFQIPDTAPESDYYIKLSLSEFQKPYHYTSTDLYITVTKSGIIDQNISIDEISIQSETKSDALNILQSVALQYFAFIDSRDKPTLAISVSNGSPYFLAAAVTLNIRSPLGFEANKVLPPVVLLANQSKVVSSELENVPFGLATITAAEGTSNISLSLFALPYIGYIIVVSIMLSASLALWIFARKNNML